jgi:hypothetical protein
MAIRFQVQGGAGLRGGAEWTAPAVLPAAVLATSEPGRAGMCARQAPVSKQTVQAKDDMKKLALGALRRLQKLPRLVRSFFQQPKC